MNTAIISLILNLTGTFAAHIRFTEAQVSELTAQNLVVTYSFYGFSSLFFLIFVQNAHRHVLDIMIYS